MKLFRKTFGLLLVAVLMVGILAGVRYTKISAATKPGKPVITLSETDEYGEVKITIGKTSNADGYALFYKADGDKKYTKLGELAKNGTKKRSYVAKELESGNYSFRVRAYTKKSGKKVWGSFSKVVKIEVVDAATRAHEERMHELAAEQYPDLYTLVEDGKMGLTMDDSSNVYFTLGSYEMVGKNENYSSQRDIEWIVVDYNEDEGKALLLSRYILDHKNYNDKYEDIDWEKCSLRSWLNEEFLYKAFSKKEIDNIILKTEIINDENNAAGLNGGKNTKDRVFLLSSKEFAGISSKSSKIGTRYDGIAEEYWVRGPGNTFTTARYVTSKGSGMSGQDEVEWYMDIHRTIKYANFRGIVDNSNTDTVEKLYVKCGGTKYKFESSLYASGFIDDSGFVSNHVYGVRPAIWVNMNAD